MNDFDFYKHMQNKAIQFAFTAPAITSCLNMYIIGLYESQVLHLKTSVNTQYFVISFICYSVFVLIMLFYIEYNRKRL